MRIFKVKTDSELMTLAERPDLTDEEWAKSVRYCKAFRDEMWAPIVSIPTAIAVQKLVEGGR